MSRCSQQTGHVAINNYHSSHLVVDINSENHRLLPTIQVQTKTEHKNETKQKRITDEDYLRNKKAWASSSTSPQQKSYFPMVKK